LLIAEFLGLVEDFEVVFIVGHVIDLSFWRVFGLSDKGLNKLLRGNWLDILMRTWNNNFSSVTLVATHFISILF
jgi:hypothetical protein